MSSPFKVLATKLFPRTPQKRYVYETRGERRNDNGELEGRGTYRFDSVEKAYKGIFAMMGGYTRSGRGMFDYMTPLERIDLDSGERTTDFEVRRNG